MFLHEFKKAVEIEPGIGPTGKIKATRGIFFVWQSDGVGAPLDVSGNTAETGILEPLENWFPVAWFESKVLNLRAKDFTRIESRLHGFETVAIIALVTRLHRRRRKS